MKQTKSLALITAFLLAVAVLCACSAPSSEKEVGVITVRVVTTQNFGQELMFDETLEVLPGTSAMAALIKVAEVETAYGGGFVNAINGVRSGSTGSQSMKMDWFFYVNGIQASIGALDYELYDGVFHPGLVRARNQPDHIFTGSDALWIPGVLSGLN